MFASSSRLFGRNAAGLGKAAGVAARDTIPGQLDLFGEEEEPAPEPTGVTAHPASEELVELGRRLPANLYLGTSSWNFPGWKGLVYGAKSPEKHLSAEGLPAYARHPLFASVGLDRTYYGPLEAGQFRHLALQLPERFRLLVKAHEDCSLARFPIHKRYGRRAGEKNPLFLDPVYAREMVVEPALEGLGPHLGPILFQFPPQNIAEFGGPVGFAQQLYSFLEALPEGVLYAIELRNPELLTPTYAAVLDRLEASHCFNVHPTMPDLTRQRAVVGEGPALVVRWMLGQQQAYGAAQSRYAPFNRVVDPDPASLEGIADLCREAIETGRPAYVIANNKAEGCAPLSLERLARALAK